MSQMILKKLTKYFQNKIELNQMEDSSDFASLYIHFFMEILLINERLNIPRQIIRHGKSNVFNYNLYLRDKEKFNLKLMQFYGQKINKTSSSFL